jgi:excisionase family DNA binding protein
MQGYNPAVPPPAPKILCTADEAAAMLSVSRRTIFRLIRSGDLATVPIRNTRRIPMSAMQDYVARNLVTADNDAASE